MVEMKHIKKMLKNLESGLLQNNHTLVYGGGKVGLMGIIADTVLENNREVIGIMPQFLVDREISHTGITEFIIVDEHVYQKRKAC